MSVIIPNIDGRVTNVWVSDTCTVCGHSFECIQHSQRERLKVCLWCETHPEQPGPSTNPRPGDSMMPDIQYFAATGTWVRPHGAVRADVVLQGAGSGSSGLRDGQDGEITVQSIPASQLPPEMSVTIGKGGRPGGRDGYALIITHLEPEDDQAAPVTSAAQV